MNQGLRDGVAAAPALRRTLTKEADEELALFLEMRKQEKERSTKPPQNASEIDLPLGHKQGIAPLFKITKARMDEFLNSDCGKNDYDWLLTPPGTPIVPTSDTEYRRSISSNGSPNARSTMLRSRGDHNIHQQLINPSRDTSAWSSSAMGIRRLSSSGRRSATPTGRCRTILAGPVTTSRSSTPASRATTIRSNSQAPPPRSSTPVRSSTPTSRPPVMATSDHSLRSTTPTIRPSSAIKSRPVKPADIPGFALDVPPNLRTSLPDRPSSASRVRPGALSRRSSSVEPCSPSRGRALNGGTQKMNSVRAPIAIRSKMVEHSANTRRLVPSKQLDHRSTTSFGTSLSKPSFDMAFRDTDLAASSAAYGVRSGPARSRTLSVSNSPLATSSSTTSSERSVNNNHLVALDGSGEVEDDVISEKGSNCSSTISITRQPSRSVPLCSNKSSKHTRKASFGTN